MEIHKVNNGIVEAYIPTNDFQNQLIKYDLEVYPIFRKYIDPEKDILDVGACFGLMSLFFSKETTENVYSYEPMEYNFNILKRNTKEIKNIILKNYAIGNSKDQDASYNIFKREGNLGMAQLYQKGINDGMDNVINNTMKNNNISKLPITIKSLDDEYYKNYCGFVKLDVEGFELPALLGAREFIKKHKPNIFVEIHSWTINEIDYNYKAEIFDLFKKLNYKLDYTFKSNEEFIFIPK